MTSIARPRRNDGKPARQPRLGIPAGSPKPAIPGAVVTRAPDWHELVQAGPKGDPDKKAKRAAAVRHGVREALPPQPQGPTSAVVTYAAQHPERVRLDGGLYGRLDTHRTRMSPAANDQPRPDVLRRRLIRVGRSK